jgi:ribose 5-phosphate isomerase B
VKLVISADHAGFPLKEEVRAHLSKAGHEVVDLGAFKEEPQDDGVGVCVAANKIPGIRAGMCHDTYSAHQGVEHDDMNVIVLGARIIGSELAFECVDAFVKAEFIASEARFVRRFKKVMAIEAKYQCGDGGSNPA